MMYVFSTGSWTVGLRVPLTARGRHFALIANSPSMDCQAWDRAKGTPIDELTGFAVSVVRWQFVGQSSEVPDTVDGAACAKNPAESVYIKPPVRSPVWSFFGIVEAAVVEIVAVDVHIRPSRRLSHRHGLRPKKRSDRPEAAPAPSHRSNWGRAGMIASRPLSVLRQLRHRRYVRHRSLPASYHGEFPSRRSLRLTPARPPRAAA